MKKYINEIELYPEIISWLKSVLKQRYGEDAKKITVLDTHNSDLSNFIINLNYQRFFREFSTFQIRVDITGFIEYADKVNLVFIECKNSKLNIRDLSQLIGYSCIALPIQSYLLSPYGMGTVLNKLIRTFRRMDILEFRNKKKISIVKWDGDKRDIDFMNSILL
jgi:hypothetical protein